MALDPKTGRRAPGRPPLPKSAGEMRTAASMLGHAINERVSDAPATNFPSAFNLPSEMPDPDPSPTEGVFGGAGGRTPLHEPSVAAMAAGFGRPSADGIADLAEGPQPFVRKAAGRVPFGVREQRMAWPEIRGYHLHWFNDEPGRIRRAEMAGYSFVEHGGRTVTTTVGVDRGGKAQVAYLMKLQQDWYDEDRMAIEHEQQSILGAIQRGAFEAGKQSYVPAQGIRIDQRLERR